jgi:hypothetical protein
MVEKFTVDIIANKTHYNVHKNPPFIATLSQLTPDDVFIT